MSEVLRQMAELHRDIYERLGRELWHEAERRAAVTAQPLGTVLASLVKGGLGQDPKSKK